MMCSADLLKALHSIQYVSSELLTEEDYRKMEQEAKKLAKEVSNQINPDQRKLEKKKFDNSVDDPEKDINWIWEPDQVCVRIASRAGVAISSHHYDEIEAIAKLRDQWIAELKHKE